MRGPVAVLSCLVAIAPLACRDTRRAAPQPEVTSAPSGVRGRSWTGPPAETRSDSLPARRLPRVVYQGGTFLRNPRIVTVTFPLDDATLIARLARFGETVTRTPWWREVVDAYCSRPNDPTSCIGDGQPGVLVRLETQLPPSMDETEVETVVARAVSTGRIAPVDEDTLVLVYLPERVTLTTGQGPSFCGPGGARAFHRAVNVDGRRVPYAVLPRCPGADADDLTATASHEILESTTNPDPIARGFAFERNDATLGFTTAGLEPVDPCGLITMDAHRTHTGDFVVQRAWSNRAASVGHDPCVPSRPERPYTALVPRAHTLRLRQVGESATVTLDAAADRAASELGLPRGAFAIHAIDLSGYRTHEELLELSLDRAAVAPGETASLKVTLRKRPPGGIATIGLVSSVGVIAHLWPIGVVTQ